MVQISELISGFHQLLTLYNIYVYDKMMSQQYSDEPLFVIILNDGRRTDRLCTGGSI